MTNTKREAKVGVGVMILKKGRVLLGLRNTDPKKADSELHGEGTWTMPGGKLDYKEHLVDCAQREVFEETSLKISKSKLKIISVADDIVSDSHFVTIGFLCKDFKGSVKTMEPDEIVKWKWFGPKQIPENIFIPSQKILDNYLLSSSQ